jgi:hypothetical protein
VKSNHTYDKGDLVQVFLADWVGYALVVRRLYADDLTHSRLVSGPWYSVIDPMDGRLVQANLPPDRDVLRHGNT